MKKTFYFFAASLLSVFACDNNAENQSQKIVSEFADYVDSVKKVTPEYVNSFWDNIESNYEKKEAKAEAVRANLKESLRKDIDDSKSEFAAFKAQYKEEKQKYEQELVENKKSKIRNALFGEDKVNADLGLVWVGPGNIAEVYKNFVDAVEANKKDYTEADWDYLREIFKSLDSRRDEIAKEISGKDKLKITEQKVRFEAIKAVN